MREEAFGPVVVVQPVAEHRGRAGARQLVGVRAAGRLLHRKPRNGVQEDVAQVQGRLPVDQRGEPLPPRHLSFGGVGASGYGREGVRYAMEELSQWKFTGIRLNPA